MIDYGFVNLYKVMMVVVFMGWSVLILLGIFLFSFAGVSAIGEGSAVAYWQMEDDLDDSVGEYDGGSWIPVEGGDYDSLKVGMAAKMEAVEMISLPDASNLDSAFSIEMWMKSGIFENAILFEKGSYKIEWVVLPAAPTKGYIWVSNGSVVLKSVEPLTQDVGYHIALVWDASGGKLILYVDGGEVDEVELLSKVNAAGVIKLGEGFVGLIDEVAIFGEALSAGDIEYHYDLSSAGKGYLDASGVGGVSSTRTDFNIAGCSWDSGVNLPVGTCSADGEYYCDSGRNGWVTREVGRGCSKGAVPYVSGSGNCCPDNMFCKEVATGVYQCESRLVNCFSLEGEVACKEKDCVWLGDSCVDNVRDLSCGYYESEPNCGADLYKLGQDGMGAEHCGTTIDCNGKVFSVPESGCKCVWVDSGVCQLSMDVVEMFYTTAGSQRGFSCSNSYELGLCVDGEQEVTWNSTDGDIVGFVNFDHESCLVALDCKGGESVRTCGEEVIRVPGFSLFAFFASLFVVGVCYFFKVERFK